jgi:hypothetical protein
MVEATTEVFRPRRRRLRERIAAGIDSALARDAHLVLIQLAGAFAVLCGISFWSVPCALILGGLGAIWAVELHNKVTADQLMAAKARTVKEMLVKAKANGNGGQVNVDTVVQALAEP